MQICSTSELSVKLYNFNLKLKIQVHLTLNQEASKMMKWNSPSYFYKPGTSNVFEFATTPPILSKIGFLILLSAYLFRCISSLHPLNKQCKEDGKMGDYTPRMVCMCVGIHLAIPHWFKTHITKCTWQDWNSVRVWKRIFIFNVALKHKRKGFTSRHLLPFHINWNYIEHYLLMFQNLMLLSNIVPRMFSFEWIHSSPLVVKLHFSNNLLNTFTMRFFRSPFSIVKT